MPAASQHILLVDGDAALSAALKFALEAEGHRVELVADAQRLLARALPAGPVCILIEQALPAVSGIEVLEKLRAAGATATLLLMATQPSSRLAARARAVQATILEQPILGGRLLDAIRAATAD